MPTERLPCRSGLGRARLGIIWRGRVAKYILAAASGTERRQFAVAAISQPHDGLADRSACAGLGDDGRRVASTWRDAG